MLDSDDCRGVVRSADGKLKVFHRRSVADLFQLVTDAPDFLRGASVADRVIGRGAALLMIKGGVSDVYARVISSGALNALRDAGVSVSFGSEVPYIIDRAGTGVCPVEQLTAAASSPDDAYTLIKSFLEKVV